MRERDEERSWRCVCFLLWPALDRYVLLSSLPQIEESNCWLHGSPSIPELLKAGPYISSLQSALYTLHLCTYYIHSALSQDLHNQNEGVIASQFYWQRSWGNCYAEREGLSGEGQGCKWRRSYWWQGCINGHSIFQEWGMLTWSHGPLLLKFLLYSLTTKWAPFLFPYQKHTWKLCGHGGSYLWSQTWRTETEGLPWFWGQTRLQSEILSQHSHRENKTKTLNKQ